MWGWTAEWRYRVITARKGRWHRTILHCKHTHAVCFLLSGDSSLAPVTGRSLRQICFFTPTSYFSTICSSDFFFLPFSRMFVLLAGLIDTHWHLLFTKLSPQFSGSDSVFMGWFRNRFKEPSDDPLEPSPARGFSLISLSWVSALRLYWLSAAGGVPSTPALTHATLSK